MPEKEVNRKENTGGKIVKWQQMQKLTNVQISIMRKCYFVTCWGLNTDAYHSLPKTLWSPFTQDLFLQLILTPHSCCHIFCSQQSAGCSILDQEREMDAEDLIDIKIPPIADGGSENEDDDDLKDSLLGGEERRGSDPGIKPSPMPAVNVVSRFVTFS